ncbi:hypothetical protein TrRE_jg6272, partial [Triparma retinervis]
RELVIEIEDFGVEVVEFFNDHYLGEDGGAEDEEVGGGGERTQLNRPADFPPSHLVIELLEFARFAGCDSAIEVLADFVAANIDQENVASICQLADRLNLPSLFEESLSFIMKSLTSITAHPFWGSMTPDLQARVLAMQNMVKSSIIGVGQRRNLFFGSSDEFISVFSDSLRDQRERLVEAKRRNDEIREQRSTASRWGVGEGNMDSVEYAQGKIEKQEERLRTLEVFLEEQKKIFGSREGAIDFAPSVGR